MHGLYIIGVALYWIVIAVAIIHVVMDNRQPAKTLAWAMVIYFVPVGGLLFYIFFGVNHRRERLVSQRSLDELSKRSMLGFVEQHDLHLPEAYKPVIDLFVNQNLSLPFTIEAVDIYTDGYQFVTALLQEISRAKSHIHLDLYIFEDDALGRLVADALVARAQEGVEVRIVYDDVGCWQVKDSFFESLRMEGIEVEPFLPVRFPSFTSKVNYRNHRKLIVIDGEVGFIGGMNIARRYVGDGWRDTMMKLTGRVVYALQRAFLMDWYFVDGTLINHRRYYPEMKQPATTDSGLAQVVTSSPVTPYPEIMQGYVRVIQAARSYIYIETPYFLPNTPVLFALKTAALAGVDVRVICPFHSDSRFVEWACRSYLREMEEAGAKVFMYKAGFLHSKLMVCDDSLVTCGSTNVDFRSFENNFEANVFVYDQPTAVRVKQVFLADQSQSEPLSEMAERLHPGFFTRLWESLARLLSPLL